MRVNVNKDKGYCGPFGKCVGKIKFEMELVTPVAQQTQANAVPSPGVATAPAPAPSIDMSAMYASKVWLECGIPKVAKANISNTQDWKFCRKQVKGNTAKCKLKLFKELEVGDKKKGYCVLTDGKLGKRLTQPYWTIISNAYDEQVVVTETQSAESEEDQAKADKRAAKLKSELKSEKAKIKVDTKKVEQVYQSAMENNDRRLRNSEQRSDEAANAEPVVHLPSEFQR